MRSLLLLSLLCLGTMAQAEGKTRPLPDGPKLRVDIDSQPRDAAVYIDSKSYGMEGFTPLTVQLPKGDYTVILERAGYLPVRRKITVTRAEAFSMTMERLYLDDEVRASKEPAKEPPAKTPPNKPAEPAPPAYAEVADTAPHTGILRVLSKTPNAEVWIDGQMRGTVNHDVVGVAAGRHTLEVIAVGFKPQMTEQLIVADDVLTVQVDLVAEAPATPPPVPGAPVETPPPAPVAPPTGIMGRVKIISNIKEAEVVLDGVPVGKTPLGFDLPPGEHILEIKKEGYKEARQTVRINAGEEKVLAADLLPVGPAPPSPKRGATSWSAQTVDFKRVILDLSLGYVPFAQARLTTGIFRRRDLGLDVGIKLQTTGLFTDFGLMSRLQYLQRGPVVLGVNMFLGGGLGPTERNTFLFEAGAPVTLLFGDIVRFTAHPYVQIYSDRNCPSVTDLQNQAKNDHVLITETGNYRDERTACKNSDGLRNSALGLPAPQLLISSGQDPRDRFVYARLMLRAVLEIAITDSVNLVALIEGDPVGERQSLTDKFGAVFPQHDSQVYGQLGVSFKF